MAASQFFKAAGIATLEGATKVRFSDDLIRGIKRYAKAGATRTDFVELPGAMTRVEAITYLQSHADFQSDADKATITEALSSRKESVKAGNRDKPGKEAKKPKKEKPPVKKVTVSLDAIKARAKKSTADVSIDSVLAAWRTPVTEDTQAEVTE